MTGRRKGLVGQGYMPKGGATAARVHNARVRESVPSTSPSPVLQDAAGGGRASDRRSWWLGFSVGVAGASTSWVLGLLVGGAL